VAGSPILVRLRNRAERVRQHRWRVAPYVSGERHIVMGGAPRSGTTLLRRLLDRHPAIVAGPEAKLFVPAAFNLEWLSKGFDIPLGELRAMRRESPSQGAFIDAFAARVRVASGKPRWAEKTPMNIRSLDWITGHFPQASIVHLIRDGRDVVCSMREHPDWRWTGDGWDKVLVPRSIETYARRWLTDTAAGMRWRGHPGYVEVRYEDVVAEPAVSLRGLCDAIGEAPDATWLGQVCRPVEALDPSLGRVAGAEGGPGGAGERPDDRGGISDVSVGRWRSDLSTAEQALVARLCGARLRELGYET
jgi:protein-tyrosine sulfotransferase